MWQCQAIPLSKPTYLHDSLLIWAEMQVETLACGCSFRCSLWSSLAPGTGAQCNPDSMLHLCSAMPRGRLHAAYKSGRVDIVSSTRASTNTLSHTKCTLLEVCRIVYMVVAGTNMERVWDLYKPHDANGDSRSFGLSCWILVFFGIQLILSQVR